MSISNLQIISDNVLLSYINIPNRLPRETPISGYFLSLGVVVGQIHEASMKGDTLRVLELVPWLENQTDFMDGWQDWASYCTVLRLAARDAPISEFAGRHGMPNNGSVES